MWNAQEPPKCLSDTVGANRLFLPLYQSGAASPRVLNATVSLEKAVPPRVLLGPEPETGMRPACMLRRF